MKLKNIFIFLLFSLVFSGCTTIGVIDANNDSNGNLVVNLSNTQLLTQNFLDEIALGNVEGAYIVHKFGANDAVGTTLEPVTTTGFYRTPTTATSLEIVSDDAEDSATGLGTRTIKIIGLNATGHEITEEVTMNGLTPVPLANQYLRIYRFYVIGSGSYATQTVPSQLGTITIQELGGGDIWAELDVIDGDFGVGQSEIGVYTIPKGYNCWLLKKVMSVNSVKAANIYFFQRQNITKTTAPYSSIRLVEKHIGISQLIEITSRSAINRFPELTDVGFMAETNVGTAELSVEFELVCLDNILYPTN